MKLNNAIVLLTLGLAILAPFLLSAQTWTHDFETAGGYAASNAECTDNGDDYFIRTDGSNVNDDPTGIQGAYYFAAQDIDASGCPAITGANATITFDDISISGCSGLSLEVWAAAFNSAGWDDADFVHINYDIDNSGTWNNLIWFENDGTAFNSAAMVDTNFDGDGDGATLTSAFQNVTGTITGTGTVIDIQIEFQLNSGSEDISLDNFRIFGTGCGVPPSTTITTGTITGPSFTVDCAGTDDTGTVDFTSTGTFAGGNVYSAQLSDASGSFASPTTIGTLTSTANSGLINITIPAGTSTGAGYRIRIVSNSPTTIGSSSSVFTITQSGSCGPGLPSASGLIINEWSNGNTGNREFYEFVVAGNCGDLVDIRGYILDDNNATFTNPADYDANASGIAPGHFRFTYDAQWASIPVGSLIVVYNADDPNLALPPDDPTDSDNDSLYVVPHNSTLFERCTSFPATTSPDSTYAGCAGSYATSPLTGWNPLSLRNDGDAIQVRQPDGTYYHGVSYGGSEITGGPHNLKLFTGSGSGMCGWFTDGDFFDIANWSSGTVAAGNETPGLANNPLNLAWLYLMRDTASATCPVTILPVELFLFEGRKTDHGNVLRWSTASEHNSDYFTLERSTDGLQWEEISTIASVGNSETQQDYQFVDISFREVVNYYRLKQTDLDGTISKHFKIVSIDNTVLLENELIGRYNLLGQKVDENYRGVQLLLFKDGTTKKILKY